MKAGDAVSYKSQDGNSTLNGELQVILSSGDLIVRKDDNSLEQVSNNKVISVQAVVDPARAALQAIVALLDAGNPVDQDTLNNAKSALQS